MRYISCNLDKVGACAATSLLDGHEQLTELLPGDSYVVPSWVVYFDLANRS